MRSVPTKLRGSFFGLIDEKVLSFSRSSAKVLLTFTGGVTASRASTSRAWEGRKRSPSSLEAWASWLSEP